MHPPMYNETETGQVHIDTYLSLESLEYEVHNNCNFEHAALKPDYYGAWCLLVLGLDKADVVDALQVHQNKVPLTVRSMLTHAAILLKLDSNILSKPNRPALDRRGPRAGLAWPCQCWSLT